VLQHHGKEADGSDDSSEETDGSVGTEVGSKEDYLFICHDADKVTRHDVDAAQAGWMQLTEEYIMGMICRTAG